MIHDAVIVEEDSAARGGRTTDQDDQLVPFAELMRRLQLEQQKRKEIGK